MKKLFSILFAFSILTACGSEAEESSDKTAEIPATEAVTEEIVEEVVHLNPSAEEKEFDNIEEFKEYMTSGKRKDDFTNLPKDGDVAFSPYVPQFDENNYSLTKIKLTKTSYTYSILNKSTDIHFKVSINFNKYYHTFEEMAESYKMNIYDDSGENQNIITIWGDTLAIMQPLAYSNGSEYFVAAMIDEDNNMYAYSNKMTSDDLIDSVNGITLIK